MRFNCTSVCSAEVALLSCLPSVSSSPPETAEIVPLIVIFGLCPDFIDSAAKPGSVSVYMEHSGHPSPANTQHLSESLWLPPAAIHPAVVPIDHPLLLASTHRPGLLFN